LISKKGVEIFKTHYYTIEGWDIEHGWPTKKTMEELGLNRMLKVMNSSGKVGKM
jgi:aldehyde:ferredoxin oxidoreductase